MFLNLNLKVIYFYYTNFRTGEYFLKIKQTKNKEKSNSNSKNTPHKQM